MFQGKYPRNLFDLRITTFITTQGLSEIVPCFLLFVFENVPFLLYFEAFCRPLSLNYLFFSHSNLLLLITTREEKLRKTTRKKKTRQVQKKITINSIRFLFYLCFFFVCCYNRKRTRITS